MYGMPTVTGRRMYGMPTVNRETDNSTLCLLLTGSRMYGMPTVTGRRMYGMPTVTGRRA